MHQEEPDVISSHQISLLRFLLLIVNDGVVHGLPLGVLSRNRECASFAVLCDHDLSGRERLAL